MSILINGQAVFPISEWQTGQMSRLRRRLRVLQVDRRPGVNVTALFTVISYEFS
jgi:hypothetical protein